MIRDRKIKLRRILLASDHAGFKLKQEIKKFLSVLHMKNKYLGTDYNDNIKKALIFNRNLLMTNFTIPNRLKFPLFRNILENYYS